MSESYDEYTERVGLEEAEVYAWIEEGAPGLLELWRKVQGIEPEDVRPLTIEQAAERENVSPKTIRRKLPALAAMQPAGAWRIGAGEKAPWRILPVGLDRLREATVAPQPAKPEPRCPKSAWPAKRSATRWEV